MWTRSAVTVVLLSLFVGSAEAQTSTKVVIGVGGPMTGDAAANGKQINDGAQLAADEINSQGGIKSGPLRGATIELKVFDDKDDPQLGVTVARQATSDSSLIAYIGSAFSDVSIAEAPVFERAGMPFLSVYASANSILDPPKKSVFIVPPTFDAYAYSIADTLAKDKILSVGVIHLTGTYGSLIAEYFEKRCKELGIKVTGSEPFNFGDTDFRSQLTRLKTDAPHAIAMVGLIDSDALILKQMKSLGLSVPAYDPGGITFNQDFIKVAGDNANGVVGNTPTDPDRVTPATKKLVELWKAKYHTNVIPDASAFAWEAVLGVARALEDGAQGRPDLAEHLHRISIADTGIAPLSFAASGARVGGRLWVYRVENGQFKFLDGYVQEATFKLREIPLER